LVGSEAGILMYTEKPIPCAALLFSMWVCFQRGRSEGEMTTHVKCRAVRKIIVWRIDGQSLNSGLVQRG